MTGRDEEWEQEKKSGVKRQRVNRKATERAKKRGMSF